MQKEKIDKVAVIGAGVMGHTIAQTFAQAGISVALLDLDKDILDIAIKNIRKNLQTLSEHGRISIHEIDPICDLITLTTILSDAVDSVDFVIEAAPEIQEVKNKIFKDLDELCPEDIVLASNTSGLDVYNGVNFKHPERMLYAHWFTPAHIIPLVEVVPGPMTSQQCIEFTVKLMKRIGKKTIVMKKYVPSFIVNRIQKKIVEAIFEILANDWASPQEIDLALKSSLGIRLPIIGAVQSLDFNGLDLVKILSLRDGFSLPVLDELLRRGSLGVKTASGFYEYQGQSESEILNKRDRLFLSLIDYLESINAFEPV